MGGGLSALTATAELPLDPITYLVPQKGRGKTVVQGLTDERASWLMLQADNSWLGNLIAGGAAPTIALRSGDSTPILSFSATSKDEILRPTVFLNAIGGIAAIVTRESTVQRKPYCSALEAKLHSAQPRFPEQTISLTHDGVPLYAWCKLQPAAKDPGATFRQSLSSCGVGSYPVLEDGTTFSSEPELIMKPHGRGEQKCVTSDSSRQAEGLAIVRDQGKSFFFTSGVDLVVVFAAHIELSAYQRFLK